LLTCTLYIVATKRLTETSMRRCTVHASHGSEQTQTNKQHTMSGHDKSGRQQKLQQYNSCSNKDNSTAKGCEPNTGQVHQCWAVANGQATFSAECVLSHWAPQWLRQTIAFCGPVWTCFGVELLPTLVVVGQRSAKRLATWFHCGSKASGVAICILVTRRMPLYSWHETEQWSHDRWHSLASS